MKIQKVAVSVTLALLCAVAGAQSNTPANTAGKPATQPVNAPGGVYLPPSKTAAPAQQNTTNSTTFRPDSSAPRPVSAAIARRVPQSAAAAKPLAVYQPVRVAAPAPPPPTPVSTPAPVQQVVVSAPVAPLAPPSPAPLATSGSTQVAADYRQGQLSLVAENVALGKVLELISQKIGATVDLAPELASEPVVAQLGPATPNEVLNALLNGPKFDYIVMGTDVPGQVQRVVVRRRHGMASQPVPSMHRAANAPVQSPGQENAEESPQQSEPAPQTQAEAAPVDQPSAPQQDNPPLH